MDSPSLSLVVIRAEDIDASLAFYQALGVQFVQEQHGSGPVHYSCEFAGLVLELYPMKSGSAQEPRAEKTMLGFTMASLEQTLAELKAIGIEPMLKPRESQWGLFAVVTDPSGHAVQLTQRQA